jgi:hypothetical protein
MTAPLTNSQIVTPGTGTSSNIIGTNVLLNANMNLQQAFLNMLANVAAEVAAFAKFQNLASQNVIAKNNELFGQWMQPVIDHKNENGPDWKPSGDDTVDMATYQSKTQENNATGQAINQSVSTDSSAGTNLMQGLQGDSSNFTTMVGNSIDTALATMRLQ